MSNHTKGPWQEMISGANELSVIFNDDLTKTVALVSKANSPNPIYGDEAYENASLIAAAPDLLEALIELDQWVQSQQASEYPNGTFEIVQAAINKARGEA